MFRSDQRANFNSRAVAALLARRENPIYEDVRSDVGLGMFFGPSMNPPDDERTKVNKRHKQVQAVFGNHPIQKVEKPALVEHGVNFHKPISIVISMQLKRRFRNPNYGMAGRRKRLRLACQCPAVSCKTCGRSSVR
jgi:hypothetical protein